MEEIDNTALFDLDGTLADHDYAIRRDMFALQAPGEPQIDNFWDLKKAHLIKRMNVIRRQPGWWRKLPKIPLGFTILRMAHRIGFKIHILTKGPDSKPEAWSEKVEWSQAHLREALGPEAEFDITITQNKSLVYGKVLVDDYPEYMDAWLKHRPRGLGIMPLYDYNKDYEHPNVIHATSMNLDIIEARLKVAFLRKTREE